MSRKTYARKKWIKSAEFMKDVYPQLETAFHFWSCVQSHRELRHSGNNEHLPHTEFAAIGTPGGEKGQRLSPRGREDLRKTRFERDSLKRTPDT